MRCDEIFAKCRGIHIYHGLLAVYYHCLLYLDDLAPILGLGENVKKQKATYFYDLLQHSSSATPRADIDMPALEDDYGDEFVPADAAAIMEIVGRPVDIATHPVVYGRDGGEVSIYFDRCTHASGMQRAFCSCPHHRPEKCRRYVFVHNFETRNHAAAWLLAWATQEPRLASKADRYASEPDAAFVADVLAGIS